MGSVFNFYHYDQAELDSLIALSGTFPPSNIGNLHVIAEGANYYNVPLSVAVGSFGSLEAENWKNVLLFAQIQHKPKRFSIEEKNTAFCIWDDSFNFMTDVGNEILTYSEQSFADRPVVNLVYDPSAVYSGSFFPVFNTSLINIPAIVNTFTLLGYRVVVTNDSILPDAGFYYLMLVGGVNSTEIAPLPDHVDTLLNSASTVFLHPAFGIPDENDASDWVSVRNFFGLPSGDTETIINALPESVSFNNFNVLWGGVKLWSNSLIENLPVSQINTSVANVLLSGEVNSNDIALIIQNGNKYLINSNLIHHEASYILSELLNSPMNVPTMADVAIVDDMAIIFAEYNTEINIDIPWSGNSHLIRYNSQGNKILDTFIASGGNYTETLSRGELVLLMESSAQNINELTLCSHLKNYPNPFNSETNIIFELDEPAIVKLSVYNFNGSLVSILFAGYKNKGKHNIKWDGMNCNKNIMSNGMYICRLQVIPQDKKVKNHITKMILLK